MENSNLRTLDQLIKTPRKSLITRSNNQAEYIKALRENDIVMALAQRGQEKAIQQYHGNNNANGKKVER